MKLVKGSLIVLLFFCFSATSAIAAESYIDESVILNGSFEDKYITYLDTDTDGVVVIDQEGLGGYKHWNLTVNAKSAAWGALKHGDVLNPPRRFGE